MSNSTGPCDAEAAASVNDLGIPWKDCSEDIGILEIVEAEFETRRPYRSPAQVLADGILLSVVTVREAPAPEWTGRQGLKASGLRRPNLPFRR
jgi:hypothetical protein